MRSIFLLFPSFLIACQQNNNVEQSLKSAHFDEKKKISPVLNVAQEEGEKDIEYIETEKMNISVREGIKETMVDKKETIAVQSKSVSEEIENSSPSQKSKIKKKKIEKRSAVVQKEKRAKKEVVSQIEVSKIQPTKSKPEVTPLDKIIHGIEETYSQIQSIDVDFEQTIHNEALDQDLVQTGSMHIMKPNYFLWDIQFPMEQQYYFDGSQLRVWNPMNQQLLVSKHSGTEGDVASILSDLSSISQKYQVSIISQSSRSIQLKAYPKADTGCESLKLTMDATTYHLNELTSQCSQTGDVHISFGAFSVNNRSSTAIFHWTPPEGAEIISSTELYD